MAYTSDVGDLDFGDETRRNGDYVGLPHDEANDNVQEGEAVSFDGTHIQSCAGSDPMVGVLYTYQYAGDSGGSPQPESNIVQDRNATVMTRGTVKAFVEDGVSAGDALTAGGSNDGVFDTAGSQDVDAGPIALSDAVEEGSDYYAEVLLR